MACRSCAKKQQMMTAKNAVKPSKSKSESKLSIDSTIDDEGCKYTKEQIQSKITELKNQKLTAQKKDLLNITTRIFKLNRAIRNYNTNCNQYLKDLDGLL